MKNAILTVFCLWAITTHAQQLSNSNHTISVTGEATVRIQPDQVVLQLGVESRGKDLLKTKSENGDIISKAVSYCKSKGIAEKDIQTDYLRLTPNYDYNSLGELNYYHVSQSLAITLGKLEVYEDVLTELLKIGVNKVDGVSFSTTKLKANRVKARKLAIEAAKEKALFLASEVGLTLGKVTNISEQVANNAYFGSMGGAEMSQNIVQNSGGYTEVEGLSVGMIPIRASVTLTFLVE